MTEFPYQDIVLLPHHISPNRHAMSMQDRAAQFVPFAALNGYGEAIDEVGRHTDTSPELDDDARELLDRRLQGLLGCLPEQPTVTIEYFIPDTRKQGGCYHHATGRLLAFLKSERQLVLEQGPPIPLEQITAIQADLPNENP